MARLVGLVLATVLSFAAFGAGAQERHGEILEVRSIENKGADVSEGNRTAKSIGSALGVAGGFLSGTKLGSKFNKHPELSIVGLYAGEYLGQEVAGRIAGVGESKRYMIKVGFDDGTKLAVARPSNEVAGLEKGSRVVVSGSGDGVTIAGE